MWKWTHLRSPYKHPLRPALTILFLFLNHPQPRLLGSASRVLLRNLELDHHPISRPSQVDLSCYHHACDQAACGRPCPGSRLGQCWDPPYGHRLRRSGPQGEHCIYSHLRDPLLLTFCHRFARTTGRRTTSSTTRRCLRTSPSSAAASTAP